MGGSPGFITPSPGLGNYTPAATGPAYSTLTVSHRGPWAPGLGGGEEVGVSSEVGKAPGKG